MSNSSKHLANISLPVRITDINYGNHVGNDSFVSLLHEARVQCLAKHGLSELNVGDGAGLIMSNITIDFRSEAFYGDILQIDISVQNISSAGFELIYEVSTQRADKKIIIAAASTKMICFNYEKRKVTRIPEQLALALH